MTLYISNRDGDGKTNEEGHYKLQTSILVGEVLGLDSLKVTEASPASMNVLVSTGQFQVPTSGYSYTGWNTTNVTLPIATADPANPRITTVILYVNKGASTSPSPPNNPGIATVAAVNGTPAAVPSAPTSGSLQSAAGPGNPYIILADVLVPAASTSVINARITDRRTRITLGQDLINEAAILNASVTEQKLATNSVSTNKVVDGSILDTKWRNGIAFRARRTAARSLAASTWTSLLCDSTVYNIGSAYSTSTGRFTAPVDGVYMFWGTLNSSAATNTRAILAFRTNGSENFGRSSDIQGTAIRQSGGVMTAQLTAGDYIEPWVWTAVATNVATSGVSPSEFGGNIITRI